MNRITYLILILLGNYIASFAQEKQTSDIRQLWLGYFNQTRFASNWGMWVDLHLRTREEFVKNLSQAIARFGVTYYIGDNTKLTAGYAFINISQRIIIKAFHNLNTGRGSRSSGTRNIQKCELCHG